MYIATIRTIHRHADYGLTLSNVEEAAEAIRILGAICVEPAKDVEGLIRLMRNCFGQDTAQLALTQKLANLGIRFGNSFIHNHDGNKRQPPFSDLEIRVYTNLDDDQLTLRLIDLEGNQFPTAGQASSNYTESQVAEKLGRPHRISNVSMRCDYQQTGDRIEFDMQPIAAALRSIVGLDTAGLDAEAMAREYYNQLIDPRTGTSLCLTHSSGNRVIVNCFNGLQVRNDPADHGSLIKLNGTVLSGARQSAPYVALTVHRVKDSSKKDLLDLVADLEEALWLHNY